MIRHSQSYLFGAISGTAVIAAAVVCFILFVSAQALRDWPISNLNFGGGNESAAVAPAESLGGSSAERRRDEPRRSGHRDAADGQQRHQGQGQCRRHRHLRSLRTGTMLPGRSLPRHRSMAAAVSTPRRQSSRPAPRQHPRRRVGAPRPPAREQLHPRPAGGSTPAGGNSGNSGSGNSGNGNGNGGGTPESTNVGTRTARSVTKAVRDISNAATPPPSPSPVTNTVNAVEEKVAPTPPPSSSTTETVAKAIGNVGK